jgi:uracil DNA glycosylase
MVAEKVYPGKELVYRAFRETPLEYSCAWCCLGTEPYNRAGYSNGLAFGTDQQKLPASLTAIYDAIEADAYSGLDTRKTAAHRRTGPRG